MDFYEFLGYLGALAIGLVLGLTGGGGSILTVPVLVYIIGLHPVTATAYSLFVVGTSSSFGALRNVQKGLVNFKTSLIFAIPAVIAVFCTRKFLVPAIPDTIYYSESLHVTKGVFIMVLFAVLMLIASFSMILNKKDNVPVKDSFKINYFFLVLLGFFTGIVTGTVGAGGGFIIVPILVFMAKLPMKKAVGTSLFIIAINSLMGFLGDITNMKIDWVFLIGFTAVAVVGILLGIYLSKFIDGKKLKKGFGWLVLIMGIYIIWKEINL